MKQFVTVDCLVSDKMKVLCFFKKNYYNGLEQNKTLLKLLNTTLSLRHLIEEKHMDWL